MRKDNGEKKKTYAAVFIIGIMVLSTLGFVLGYNQDTTNAQNYQDHKFRKVGNGWTTKIGAKDLVFTYHPSQLEQIPMSLNASAILSKTKQIALTYDSNSPNLQYLADAQFDLERKFNQYANSYVTSGLTNSSQTSLPQIQCENSTISMPVILIQDGYTTEIQSNESCIIASAGAPGDTLALSERIIYTTLGVMK